MRNGVAGNSVAQSSQGTASQNQRQRNLNDAKVDHCGLLSMAGISTECDNKCAKAGPQMGGRHSRRYARPGKARI